MRWVGEVFDGLGVTGQDREPAFPDGAAFRLEIPSVEGPRVLEAVLRAAEMRAAVSLPLDLYVESPDPLGGVVRGQELGDLVRTGAPLYAKFGLRNAQAIYPSGHHLEAVACANAVEKVHRAAVALEWLERLSPGLVQSKPGAAGLGLPVL